MPRYRDDTDDAAAPRGRRPEARRRAHVMQIFREAAGHGTAKRAPRGDVRAQASRITTDEAALRRNVTYDVENLTSTVRLDAVVPLDGHERVARSVLNFGLVDLSRAGASTASRMAIAAAIRQALLDHEPRLVPETLSVTLSSEHATDQRLTFDVTADIVADPADLPIDFVAEVDLGAGKMDLRPVRGTGA
ncbi:type VI secretion system baseplate subunit TssE [Jannaschia sp. LMIT008]|uniref:type VI secretion system baseplate subunit TssE n=1 Tax=Jannaschia maritima TaxID=3032585 RepID=UPI002811EEEC|nr:type VI secretion system baseplate subunit TssE [Jannaschia sp. LMIT008]